MMEKQASQAQVIPQAEQGQTKADQVWHQLSSSQQQQILQSIMQICRMLAERVKMREVGHDSHD